MRELLKNGLINPKAGLSLYFHVPFCQHKCFYCDFYSCTGIPASEQEIIIGRMLKQARTALEYLSVSSVESLYIGGGSPSLAPLKSVETLISLGKEYGATEITVEANPEQLSNQWLDTVWQAGASRLSVGIQSMDEQSLKLVGRHVSFQAITEALRLLQPYHNQVNLDLISGLPLQNKASLEQSCQALLNLNPGHISFYSLTVEDETPLFYQQHMLASEEERDALWSYGRQLLLKAGYYDYEISNYAKPGYECRHNIRYWQLKNYLGFGPSAVSNIALNDGRALRLSGKKELSLWLNEGPALYTEEIISREDFMFEHFMMGLRSTFGLDKKLFTNRFGETTQRYTQKIAPHLLRQDDHYLSLTDEGRLFLDSVLQQLL